LQDALHKHSMARQGYYASFVFASIHHHSIGGQD